MAWIGWQEGMTGQPVQDAKRELKRKFSYANGLDDGPLFTPALKGVLVEYQVRKNRELAKLGKPLLREDGVLDWATQKELGSLAPPPPPQDRPVLFTVEGHLSDMFIGPAAFTAQALEAESVCWHQPVGYDNVSLPFNNKSGVDELVRLLSGHRLPNGRPFPPGTPWGLAIFSQGGIVGCEFMMKHVFPEHGVLHWRLKDWRATLAFGNPYREEDVVAEWIPDPPKRNTQGISDRRMVNTPTDVWKEVARHGDIYTENESADHPMAEAGEQKTAIYKAVQNEWWGPGSIFWKLLEIGLNPTVGLIAATVAIVSGVMFVADMSPHGMYDLEPCKSFMRSRLRG